MISRLQTLLPVAVAAGLRQRRQDLRQRVRANVEGVLGQERRCGGARRRMQHVGRDDDDGAGRPRG